MPTIMSHALVPLAVGLILGRDCIPKRAVLAGMALAMLPDADVIGFKIGIDYADAWGHRGASHSLFAAAIVGGLTAAIIRPARYGPARYGPARYGMVAIFLFGAMASHGLLDTLTNGGLGAALLWPFSETRFHAAVTPITVSPIGIGNFLSERGLTVLMSEARWIWLPCALAVGLALMVRRITSSRSKGPL